MPSVRHRRIRTLGPRRRAALGARRARRFVQIALVAVAGGLAAALFARVCDAAIAAQAALARWSPPLALALLPAAFVGVVALTRRFAPEAAGSGIPQVIAAAEERWTGRWGGRRVTLTTAAWKVVLTVAFLLGGASIGREGPTVQVVAGILRTLTRGLRGGPGRRAMIIAGGAAGVSAAFNTPIAGVVFAVEELAKSFERRTNGTVILVVVMGGFAAYAMQGDYAYFGDLAGAGGDLGAAWLAAPVLGVACGAAGGLFSRALALLAGPGPGPLRRLRERRPLLLALGCGLAAAALALASGGLTYGAGYAAAKGLLVDHPSGGLGFALAKALATLAAAVSGAPGGIFAPSLATGAGMGAAFAEHVLPAAGRDAVVLGMAAYLSGVVQAPLTSAVILMEMTRDPGLVGPLLLAALAARWTSGLVMPEPIYHVLSTAWRRARPLAAPAAAGL